MIDFIKNVFSDAEEFYDKADKYVTGQAYELYENIFKDDENAKLINEQDKIITMLNDLEKEIEKINKDTHEVFSKEIIHVATRLGHINESVVNNLCRLYNINISILKNQASKIRALDRFLQKAIIKDFYFINDFRNSILHHNEISKELLQNHDLTVEKIKKEASAAIAKAKYIYTVIC